MKIKRASSEALFSIKKEAFMKKKKIFVVSDVHGHETILKDALSKAGFDSKNPEHLLVSLGDYFDRGSENRGVLSFFERLEHKVLLRGNHEDLFLKILLEGKLLQHNYINGSLQTITEFFGKFAIDPATDEIDFSGKSRVVDRLLSFIGETVDYFETEKYVFVHGWLPEKKSSFEDRKKATSLEWEKARWEKWTEHYEGKAPLSDKILVCGHVPTFFATKFDPARPKICGDIFYGNGMIALDAGTFETHQVNVLVIEDTLL